MTQAERNMEIGKEILRQLGSFSFHISFAGMIGLKDPVAIENGIQFGFMKANQGINKVVITLNSSDTYDLKFWNIGRTKFREIVGVGDIMSDQLIGVFENITGLDTHI